jgi:hypothetical protein
MASRVKSVYILGWLGEYLRTTGSVSVVVSGNQEEFARELKSLSSCRHDTSQRRSVRSNSTLWRQHTYASLRDFIASFLAAWVDNPSYPVEMSLASLGLSI